MQREVVESRHERSRGGLSGGAGDAEDGESVRVAGPDRTRKTGKGDELRTHNAEPALLTDGGRPCGAAGFLAC